MPNPDIYKQLKESRKGQALTQQQLSQYLRLPQGYISQVEAGKHDIKLSTLSDWARVLGFEFMLIPKEQVPEISYLLQAGTSENAKPFSPAYRALPEGPSDE